MRASVLPIACYLLALAVLLALMPYAEPLLRLLAPDSKTVLYTRDSLTWLLGQHLLLVALAGGGACLLAVTLAVLVTRPFGRSLLPVVSQLASAGQTFPPVAVLVLAVPALGYGFEPTITALLLYGLLPVLVNAITGLQQVSSAVKEAALAMGMSPRQVLWQVELPLALGVILTGARTTFTFTVATAAIGSTIGARTLGDPIIAGLINDNLAFVVQGSLVIGLLALLLDELFEGLFRYWQKKGLPSSP